MTIFSCLLNCRFALILHKKHIYNNLLKEDDYRTLHELKVQVPINITSDLFT